MSVQTSIFINWKYFKSGFQMVQFIPLGVELETCIQWGRIHQQGLQGHDYLWFCNRLEFKMITSMSVQTSILNGEVFQIEVSDIHGRQIVNFSPTWVFTGARVFMFL